jgi:CBS-domain-containing membrane protein
MRWSDLHVLDEKFKKNPFPFIFQSILAALFLSITFILIWTINPVVVAGIGSTTFILFALPNNRSNTPRNIIGGHTLAMGIGVACSYIPIGVAAGGVAVGFAILIMTATDTEHPPAASTALGIAVEEFNTELLLFVVVATTLLVVFQRLIRKYLIDLV